MRGGGGRHREHAVAHGERAALARRRGSVAASARTCRTATSERGAPWVQRLTARGALPTTATRVGWQSAEPARTAPEEMPMLPLLAPRAIKRSRRGGAAEKKTARSKRGTKKRVEERKKRKMEEKEPLCGSPPQRSTSGDGPTMTAGYAPDGPLSFDARIEEAREPPRMKPCLSRRARVCVVAPPPVPKFFGSGRRDNSVQPASSGCAGSIGNGLMLTLDAVTPVPP